jgi:IS5 family transposase
MEQVSRLTKHELKAVMIDQGYRGYGYTSSTIVHEETTIPHTSTCTFRWMLKRRAAIEPTIGHLKSDHRLDRNHLHGPSGDKINALLAAAGYNLRLLLRWILFRFIFRSGAT